MLKLDRKKTWSDFLKGDGKMVMLFINEHARKQLLKKGEVVTFRRKQHKEGLDWATDKRGGNKICNIYITCLCKVEKIEDLIPYVSLSGFNSIKDWVSAIRNFIGKSELKGYLYYVKKIQFW
jgi:hypothetical protein